MFKGRRRQSMPAKNEAIDLDHLRLPLPKKVGKKENGKKRASISSPATSALDAAPSSLEQEVAFYKSDNRFAPLEEEDDAPMPWLMHDAQIASPGGASSSTPPAPRSLPNFEMWTPPPLGQDFDLETPSDKVKQPSTKAAAAKRRTSAPAITSLRKNRRSKVLTAVGAEKIAEMQENQTDIADLKPAEIADLLRMNEEDMEPPSPEMPEVTWGSPPQSPEVIWGSPVQSPVHSPEVIRGLPVLESPQQQKSKAKGGSRRKSSVGRLPPQPSAVPPPEPAHVEPPPAWTAAYQDVGGEMIQKVSVLDVNTALLGVSEEQTVPKPKSPARRRSSASSPQRKSSKAAFPTAANGEPSLPWPQMEEDVEPPWPTLAAVMPDQEPSPQPVPKSKSMARRKSSTASPKKRSSSIQQSKLPMEMDGSTEEGAGWEVLTDKGWQFYEPEIDRLFQMAMESREESAEFQRGRWTYRVVFNGASGEAEQINTQTKATRIMRNLKLQTAYRVQAQTANQIQAAYRTEDLDRKQPMKGSKASFSASMNGSATGSLLSKLLAERRGEHHAPKVAPQTGTRLPFVGTSLPFGGDLSAAAAVGDWNAVKLLACMHPPGAPKNSSCSSVNWDSDSSDQVENAKTGFARSSTSTGTEKPIMAYVGTGLPYHGDLKMAVKNQDHNAIRVLLTAGCTGEARSATGGWGDSDSSADLSTNSSDDSESSRLQSTESLPGPTQDSSPNVRSFNLSGAVGRAPSAQDTTPDTKQQRDHFDHERKRPSPVTQQYGVARAMIQKEHEKKMRKSHAELIRKSRTVSGPIKDAVEELTKKSPSSSAGHKIFKSSTGLPELLASVFPGMPGLNQAVQENSLLGHPVDFIDELESEEDVIGMHENAVGSKPQPQMIGKPEGDAEEGPPEQPIHVHDWLASRALQDTSHWLWDAVKTAGDEESDEGQDGEDTDKISSLLDALDVEDDDEDEDDPWRSHNGEAGPRTAASLYKANRKNRRQSLKDKRRQSSQSKSTANRGSIIAAINGDEDDMEPDSASDDENLRPPPLEVSSFEMSKAGKIKAQVDKQKKQEINATANRALLKKKAEDAANKGVNRGGQHLGLVPLLQKIVRNLNGDDSEAFYGLLASGELFDETFTRQYPARDTAEDKADIMYGSRGGKPYYKPNGWIRFGLKRDAFDQSGYKDWCVAYHGTKGLSALQILLRGLQRPGENGVRIAHGQVHSESGASIYLSPSIEYSAFPCYAQLFEVSSDHWAQLVLLCRVRPGSFKEASGTLTSNKHWPPGLPMDVNFPDNKGLEWLVEDSADVMVYGLMVREFGGKASASLYGQIVTQVHQGERGPEYVWSQLRAQLMREDSKRRAADKAKQAHSRREELQKANGTNGIEIIEAEPCTEEEVEAHEKAQAEAARSGFLRQASRTSTRSAGSARRYRKVQFSDLIPCSWSSLMHALPLLLVLAIVTLLDRFLGMIVGIGMCAIVLLALSYRGAQYCKALRKEEQAEKRERENREAERENRERYLAEQAERESPERYEHDGSMV